MVHRPDLLAPLSELQGHWVSPEQQWRAGVIDFLTLQEFADARVAPEYRQPLKTAAEAMRALEWPEADFPECCGQPVKVTGFLGCADLGECVVCGKFMANAFGPEFGNAWVSLPNLDGMEGDPDRCWITGVRKPEFRP